MYDYLDFSPFKTIGLKMTWHVVVICCSVWLLLKIIVWPQMLPGWRWWVHFVHHCHCHCWPIVANSGHLKVSIQIVFGRITILFCFSCSSTVVGVVATPLQVGIRNDHIWQRCLRGKYKNHGTLPKDRRCITEYFAFILPHSLLDEFVVVFFFVFCTVVCSVHTITL